MVGRLKPGRELEDDRMFENIWLKHRGVKKKITVWGPWQGVKVVVVVFFNYL